VHSCTSIRPDDYVYDVATPYTVHANTELCSEFPFRIHSLMEILVMYSADREITLGRLLNSDSPFPDWATLDTDLSLLFPSKRTSYICLRDKKQTRAEQTVW
jgi:hypothetical protein